MAKWTFLGILVFMIGCASSTTKNKEKARLYLKMGITQIESGDYPMALKSILTAEELDPTDPVIQNNLGLVYFFRDKYDLAEQHLEKALNLSPKYSEARNNLSRVYLEQNKYGLAEKEARAVIEDLTYPNPEKAYFNLGLVQFNQKQYLTARSSFSRALKTSPDDCASNTYFARTYFETQDYTTAAETLDRAIGFCQKSLYDEPHFYSALAYYRLGDKSKAIARFEELLKFYPSGAFRDKARGMLNLIRKGH